MSTQTTVQRIQIAEPAEGVTIHHIALFAICFFGNAFGGTISTLMSVYLPVAVKDLLGSRDTEEMNQISGYINAMFIFGWAAGGFIWGVVSDKIGRKKALLSAIGFYGLFTVLTSMMTSWGAIVLCRFMTGFGVGGVLVTSFTLLSEAWPEKSKSIFMGISSIAFPVGIFSAGLTNYIVSSWREGFLVGMVPMCFALLGIFLIQESPKWIEHKTNSDSKENTIAILFSESHKGDVISGSIVFGAMLIGLWAIFSWLPTWVQSLVGVADANKQRGMSMMLLGMGGLSGGFLSGWFLNAVGSRKAMMICFGVCAALSFVLFKTNPTFSPIIYGEIGLLALFFGLSQGVLSVYIPQLFPTSIRSTATGFCFNIGRLVTATAVLFVAVLVTTLGGYGNCLFVFSLIFVIGLAVILFGSKRKKTETISQ